MGKKNKGERFHDGLVEKLAENLEQYYKRVETFKEYSRNGVCGEVDILCMGEGFWDFCEVKTTYSKKSLKKATEQYHRFQTAYPNKDINGFIYTSDEQLRKLD